MLRPSPTMAEVKPTPRTGAVIAVVEERVYVWGGFTQVIEGEGEDRFTIDIELPNPDDETDTAIEVYDMNQRQWYKYGTKGVVPRLGSGSTVCVVGNKLYVFGGSNDEDFSSDIFILDTMTFVWEFVKTTAGGPVPKSRAGMVVYGEKLIVFGGVGKPFSANRSDGASYIANRGFSFEFGYGWNNELHEFDSVTKQWRELECTGSRPPPLGDFTFNRIDKQRALLYGGRVERRTFSSVYILDLKQLYWTGPFEPQSPDQPWPAPRCLHTSCCLVDPSSDMATYRQKLITFWGKGADNKHVNDIWILDVASMRWKELKLDLRARMYQMSCSYHHGGMKSDAITFGGNKRRQSKFDKHVMTDLRILRFGIVEDLQGMCVRLIGNNWDTLRSHAQTGLPNSLQVKIQRYLDNPDEIIYPSESNFA